jgi:signal peptidase I
VIGQLGVSKRVIGGPGDVVEMRDEVVYLNDRRLDYDLVPAEAFVDDIHESAAAVVAREWLGREPHFIMVLPDRPAWRTFGPVAVPTGHFFVLGDSRNNSHDSRFFGLVERDRIVGRASLTLVSFDLRRWAMPRVERFFALLMSRRWSNRAVRRWPVRAGANLRRALGALSFSPAWGHRAHVGPKTLLQRDGVEEDDEPFVVEAEPSDPEGAAGVAA